MHRKSVSLECCDTNSLRYGMRKGRKHFLPKYFPVSEKKICSLRRRYIIPHYFIFVKRCFQKPLLLGEVSRVSVTERGKYLPSHPTPSGALPTGEPFISTLSYRKRCCTTSPKIIKPPVLRGDLYLLLFSYQRSQPTGQSLLQSVYIFRGVILRKAYTYRALCLLVCHAECYKRRT